MTTPVQPNTVASLTNPGIGTKVLPPLKLKPYPDKLLKIVPEMKEFRQQEQQDIDQWLKKLTVAINGGIS